MKSDIAKISRLYESTYSDFISNGFKEKDSFYLLNDILIMICLQSKYNEDDMMDFKTFKNKIQLYEDGLGTPLFFKKYNSIKSNNDFNNIYTKFKKLIDINNNDYDNIQILLGYVLEKHINRRKTGSYYTPDDTTKYITHYSIFISLFNKLKGDIQNKLVKAINIIIKKYNLSDVINEQYDLIKYNVDLDTILNELFSTFNNDDLNIINKEINNIKVIDPTCGSGAFIITAFDFIYKLKEKINYKVKMNIENEVVNILKILHGLDNSYEAISLLKMRLILKIISKGLMPKNFEEIFSKNFILADAFTGRDFVIKNSHKKSFDWTSFGYKFDCIVGNPPYVESKGMLLNDFYSIKCGNLYAYTIERSYNILNNNGILSFIVPLPLISTPRMKPIRDYMFENSSKLYISTYADRPGCIFKGVHQRLTIFFANKSYEKCNLFSSSYNYWYNDERDNLFKNIKYIENDDYDNIPKVGQKIEKDIISKVNKIDNKLPKIIDKKDGKYKLYLSTRLGLWSKCFMHEIATNEIKQLNCESQTEQRILNCFFNSSTFYYLWILLSDCWHVTLLDIANIKFDYSKLNNDEVDKLEKLSIKLENDLEKNKKYIGSKQVEYEYKHKFSKFIIDDIDRIIGKIYSFTDEEIEFIINYAYKYRMNDLAEEVET